MEGVCALRHCRVYKALTKTLAPYIVSMDMELETEVLRRVMLGELKAPVLDANGDAPLVCLTETDTLGELLYRLESVGGRTNLYIDRADGTIATLAISEIVPGTNGII